MDVFKFRFPWSKDAGSNADRRIQDASTSDLWSWDAFDNGGGLSNTFQTLGTSPSPAAAAAGLEHHMVTSGAAAPGQLVFLDARDVMSPVQSATGGSAPIASSSVTTSAAPAPTLVGTAGKLQLNLIWDASVTAAPSGFQAAAIKAASQYASLYSNNEVINIQVGFGEVGGKAMPSGALGASSSYGYSETYASVAAALKKDASSSSWQATADASLSATDPTRGGSFFVSTAQAKALGQVSGAGTAVDGFVGLSSSYGFSYTSQPSSTQFDAVGVFEHEFSEVMGRMGSVGSAFGANVYTPLDLFRYAAAGVRALVAGPGYLSVNGGKTNLGTYNNPRTGGDAADWIPTLPGDAYGSGYQGRAAHLSSTDIIETSLLGYTMTTSASSLTKTPGLG